MKIELVHPTQLSVQDITHLARGCLRIKFQKVDPQQLVRMALTKELNCYKMWGADCSGIALVAPRGDTLWVEMITGKGLLKHFDEVGTWLESLARSHGAHSLSFMLASPALYKLWQRRGAKAVAQYFVKEIENGRLTESSEN